uniref:Uncharacterized protein n=1 Tax=Nelumbo nucifera TaxID=4432 RepID=A0A822YNM3_NELNU|nr:TPA_asm: hypothetical protein HUJ06_011446 [Nelumbo nucifera]
MALATKIFLLLGIVFAIIQIISPLEVVGIGGPAPDALVRAYVLPPPICKKYDWVCLGASETSTPEP